VDQVEPEAGTANREAAKGAALGFRKQRSIKKIIKSISYEELKVPVSG
jgi:hypothetical protein